MESKTLIKDKLPRKLPKDPIYQRAEKSGAPPNPAEAESRRRPRGIDAQDLGKAKQGGCHNKARNLSVTVEIPRPGPTGTRDCRQSHIFFLQDAKGLKRCVSQNQRTQQ